MPTISTPATPSLGYALVPIVTLVVLLGSSVYLFGDESSAGPNQIALILGTSVASVIGLANGRRWSDLEKAIEQSISTSTKPLLILLMVGAVIGTWSLAGVVPTMIYYGLSLLEPSIFYAAACIICAIVAVATGSSWTTVGTIGLALIGMAGAYELNLGVAAGAIISGAYFGDKMSPLSDTTNLAAAVAGSDLFEHIRHMMWTTGPSFAFALIGFVTAGVVTNIQDREQDLRPVIEALETSFTIGPHLLIPVVLVLVLVIRRTPALPALLTGALTGGLFAVLFQQDAVLRYVGDTTLPRAVALGQGVWQALYGGYTLDSGNVVIDDLLSRGGMASMLMTVWLIITAMMFGAVMEAAGFLETIARRILNVVSSTGSLIATTLATSFGINLLAADQYIAIVLPGRMFRDEYKRRKLHPKNLSRTLEDSGTLTSALVPWNTCGAFMAQTLGVSTLTYAPYTFFNLINPFVAVVCGFTKIGLDPLQVSSTAPDDTTVA